MISYLKYSGFENLNTIAANQGLLIPAMSEPELRTAITEPARTAGHELNDAIVSLLINDSHQREGSLPLLQVILSNIWDGLREGVAPEETYKRLGGVGGALASAAEEVFVHLDETEQRIARRVFIGLVKPWRGYA